MEALGAIGAGVVVASGTYLLMTRDIIRVILGSFLMGLGVNMVLFMSGGVKRGGVPILGEAHGAEVTDPVPQALILTAIVISLGVLAVLMALGYRTYQETGSDDLETLTGIEDE